MVNMIKIFTKTSVNSNFYCIIMLSCFYRFLDINYFSTKDIINFSLLKTCMRKYSCEVIYTLIMLKSQK